MNLVGGRAVGELPGLRVGTPDPLLVFGGTLCFSLGTLGVASAVLRARNPARRGDLLCRWAMRGYRWWGLGALWSVLWLASLAFGWLGPTFLIARTTPLVLAMLLGLWGAEWFPLWRAARLPDLSLDGGAVGGRRGWRAVTGGVLLYTVCFTAMNWGLWFNLQIPHGDSAMYEEHLWNLEHGKGFRSYLDQGLFLGEHIQVVHLLLVPLHLIWPSHLLLELCESLALAGAAWPVYAIARRHGGASRAAMYLAFATLLYFPLQSIDISIDFKTFRPIAFGIPLLLAAIDQYERGRLKTMAVCLLLTLSAKEDYAIPIACYGAWLMFDGWWSARRVTGTGTSVGNRGGESVVANEASVARHEPALTARSGGMVGAILFVGATAYLVFAVKFAIPWFRGGEGVPLRGTLRSLAIRRLRSCGGC
ncbi:MAG: DUF2079 domain-containing protein [Planctomycetaceae bacterium]